MNKTIRQKLIELAFRLTEATNAAADKSEMYGEDWDGSVFLTVIQEIATELDTTVLSMMEHDKE